MVATAETKLTTKQDLFCREYMVDFNGTQAAIRAGYSENTAKVIASQTLTKVNVSNRISELLNERKNSTDITAENVLRNINEIAMNGKHEHTKLKGLDMLSKHLNLYQEKAIEVSINLNITNYGAEDGK